MEDTRACLTHQSSNLTKSSPHTVSYLEFGILGVVTKSILCGGGVNGLAKAGNVISSNWFFTHLAGGCLKLTTLAERHKGVQRWLKVVRAQGTSVGISKLGYCLNH